MRSSKSAADGGDDHLCLQITHAAMLVRAFREFSQVARGAVEVQAHDGVGSPVGSGAKGIRRPDDANDGAVKRDSDVHRTRVVTQDDLRSFENRGEPP